MLPCRLAAAREARGTPPGCKKARVGRLQQETRSSKARSGCALGKGDDDEDGALMVVLVPCLAKWSKCAWIRCVFGWME